MINIALYSNTFNCWFSSMENVLGIHNGDGPL